MIFCLIMIITELFVSVLKLKKSQELFTFNDDKSVNKNIYNFNFDYYCTYNNFLHEDHVKYKKKIFNKNKTKKNTIQCNIAS